MVNGNSKILFGRRPRRRETKSNRDFRPVEKCGKLIRACRQVCVQILQRSHPYGMSAAENCQRRGFPTITQRTFILVKR
jgi:hypothetical protein